MHSRKRRHARSVPPSINSLFAEELESPRHSRKTFDSKPDHKTRQLCRQVERALSLALAGECGDEVLRELLVDEVLPAPNASRLLVRVIVPSHLGAVTLAEVLDRLGHAAGLLRRAAAEAITRKRVPELTFMPVGPGEVLP